jgi:hypothetical protein
VPKKKWGCDCISYPSLCAGLVTLLQVATEINSLYGFTGFLKSGRKGVAKRKKRPGASRFFSAEISSLARGKKALYLS